jgi:hypothetical protein
MQQTAAADSIFITVIASYLNQLARIKNLHDFFIISFLSAN